MNNKLTYCLIIFGFVLNQSGVYAQKDKKEHKIKHQSKDDNKQLLKQNESQLSYKNLFYEAVRLKTVGAFDSSLALFEKCTEMNPKSDAAFFALSEFYTIKRQYNHALKNVEAAHLIDPKNIWYLEKTAALQLTVGQYKEAEKSYLSLTQKNPHNIDWMYGYSQAQLFNGNIKDAIVTYDRMIEEVGPIPELVARKVELMVDQKQDEEAVKELRNLIKKHPDKPEFANILLDYYHKKGDKENAQKLLANLVETYPKNGIYQLRMAEYYDKKGDDEAMYRYLKKAFKNRSVDIDTKVKLLISAHDNYGKIDTNILALAKILRTLYPNDAKSHTISGDLLLKSKQPKKALEAFKTALKYDQSKFSIWKEVLIQQYKTQEYDSLFVYGKKALELYPSYANLYLLTGIGALFSDHLDAAADCFTQGQNYATTDKKMRAEFMFQLGETQVKQNKLDEAWSNFNQAIELDPKNALYLNNFAYHLAVKKVRLDTALGMIKKANLIAPNNANFLDTYAWVLFKMKNYKTAGDKMAEALSLSPKNPVFLEHYGDILFFLNEKSLAVDKWKKAQLLGNKSQLLIRKISSEKYYEALPE